MYVKKMIMNNKDLIAKLKEYEENCRIALFNGSSLSEYIVVTTKRIYMGGGRHGECVYLFTNKGYEKRFSNKDLQSILSEYPDDMPVYRSDGFMRDIEIWHLGHHESSFGKYIEL